MPTTVVVQTYIRAPIEVCFDRARDIGLHVETARSTRERAVAGVTEGLIGLGDEVTFEGVHFGIRQQLRSRIVDFERPVRFVDEMQEGAFASLRHVHEFRAVDGGTQMTDTLSWKAPLGPLGRLADVLFLRNHMRHFLEERNAGLKRIVEATTS